MKVCFHNSPSHSIFTDVVDVAILVILYFLRSICHILQLLSLLSRRRVPSHCSLQLLSHLIGHFLEAFDLNNANRLYLSHHLDQAFYSMVANLGLRDV